jgi:hypothetical protein
MCARPAENHSVNVSFRAQIIGRLIALAIRVDPFAGPPANMIAWRKRS